MGVPASLDNVHRRATGGISAGVAGRLRRVAAELTEQLRPLAPSPVRGPGSGAAFAVATLAAAVTGGCANVLSSPGATDRGPAAVLLVLAGVILLVAGTRFVAESPRLGSRLLDSASGDPRDDPALRNDEDDEQQHGGDRSTATQV